MKYKLFLSDFDGTLVRPDGTIPQKNIEAIARYRKAGGIFAVCTGRMLVSILPRLKELGLDEGLVAAYQGAVVADIATGKLLKDECFSEEDALRAIEVLEEENVHIHVYSADTLFTDRDDDMLRSYERICGVRGTLVEGPLSDMVARKHLSVVKVLAMVPPSERAALHKKTEEKLGERFFVTCSSEWLVEIMPRGQSKAQAVEFLARYYGLPESAVAAIGDQSNDVPMLCRAGGRFAVAGATEDCKKIARVLSSCEEGGVAEAIEYAMGERS